MSVKFYFMMAVVAISLVMAVVTNSEPLFYIALMMFAGAIYEEVRTTDITADDEF